MDFTREDVNAGLGGTFDERALATSDLQPPGLNVKFKFPSMPSNPGGNSTDWPRVSLPGVHRPRPGGIDQERRTVLRAGANGEGTVGIEVLRTVSLNELFFWDKARHRGVPGAHLLQGETALNILLTPPLIQAAPCLSCGVTGTRAPHHEQEPFGTDCERFIELTGVGGGSFV